MGLIIEITDLTSKKFPVKFSLLFITIHKIGDVNVGKSQMPFSLR
jgi:hypothetical protein